MMDGVLEAWRHIPAHLSPIAFKIGVFELRWYGICYFLAIFISFLLSSWRIRRAEYALKLNLLEDYYFVLILGIVLGARIGYVIFYQWDYYSTHLLEILLPFQLEGGFRFTGISGLSFHGGYVGSIIATGFFCRKHRISFWKQIDFIVPSVPAGYILGRLGNFLNGELYGRTTHFFLGMIFPNDPSQMVRHPSQLYESAGEGLLLFLILWPLRNRQFFPGWILCAYMFGYGAIRFVIEFAREPDEQLGLLNLGFSMGQWLCLGMMSMALILAGYLFFQSRGTNDPVPR